ncbi:PREDICTED: polygalacturonase-like [Nelumbo nucifera]|uniref:Polygalacturonase-like n=1 Tax=Nelumbo nucifera TaxID=4432 RepID=A0A1U7Z736_NELNU|nr:PREDICTED: polygalacturonase-like [Nelumbo nucifera]
MKVVFSLLCICFPLVASGNYSVVDFGADPNGETDSTQSFLKAWASACSSVTPATISVPPGKFLIKKAVFRGPCSNTAITIEMNGTLIAPSDYRELGGSGNWLLFVKVSGLSINGGTLDGQGANFWACEKNCPAAARSITFNYAMDVVINGLTSINSKNSHIVINGCENVTVQQVTVVAPDQSPNTDGIHVQMSSGVTITNTSIRTGDDCISIGPGATNLWIQSIECGPGHGISIGSLGKDLVEEGVKNVTVKDVVFTGTQNGFRIKSWARPSNGFAKQVLFQDAIMKNVRYPIIIDQNYCPNTKGCPSQSSGVKINQVTYRNIQGTSTTKVAMKFDCSVSNPCKDIKLEDVGLTYRENPAQLTCVNTDGITGLALTSSCS